MAKNTLVQSNSTQTNDRLVDKLLLHYRAKGFPYYTFSLEEKQRQLSQLINYPHSDIIVDGDILQKMHGLPLAWSYFPHSWSVQCGSMKSPMQIFESDVDLRKAILKRLKYGTGTITDAAIRKAVRSFSGAQGVSNFRPTAAAAIYHHFLPSNGGRVWDMSAGYGGRLLGAITCHHVSHYTGTDPCSDTISGLQGMARELGRDKLQIELLSLGSETFRPERNSLHACVSSPPYFLTERYSDEPTQSYLKFPDKETWLHGFLGSTLDNCWYGLKADGHLIINIANVKSYPTLERDFVEMACSRGWKLQCTLRYALSKMMGTRKPGDAPFKYEPVFVFGKR